MSAVRKKVQRPRPSPDRPNPTPRGVLYRAMKHPNYLRVLVVLAAAAIAAMLATSLQGCATPHPTPPAAPIGTDPPAQPAPPDPVAECRATIADMELAAGLAKVAAAFLVGSNSNYRAALEAAVAALDAALVNASAQCESGSVDGWQGKH